MPDEIEEIAPFEIAPFNYGNVPWNPILGTPTGQPVPQPTVPPIVASSGAAPPPTNPIPPGPTRPPIVGGAGAPENTVSPLVTIVSGGTAVGAVFACNSGTWVGSGTPTYTRQWRSGGAPISGATSASYTVQVSDEGNMIDCIVTATNPVGSASAVSNALGPITATRAAPEAYDEAETQAEEAAPKPAPKPRSRK